MRAQNNGTERVLGLLGFAARAGRAVSGVSLICTALARGASGKTPLVILEAADSSANSHKRITDRAAFYGVPCTRLECDMARLALAVGKRDGACAAVGVTEPELARAIIELLHEQKTQ